MTGRRHARRSGGQLVGDGAEQGLGGKRFFNDEGYAGGLEFGHPVAATLIAHETAGAEHLDFGVDGAKRAHQGHPVHDRHHDIGDDEGNLLRMLRIYRDGLGPVGRLDDLISVRLEDLAGDQEERGFIVDQQDRFIVAAGGLAGAGAESASLVSAAGSRTVKTVPAPGFDDTSMRP